MIIHQIPNNVTALNNLQKGLSRKKKQIKHESKKSLNDRQVISYN